MTPFATGYGWRVLTIALIRTAPIEEWNTDPGDESLELTASTKQGYLTLFVVDDGN
ncbi:MAG: hypothetical protein U0941_08425 [Planctomycetaceae bacterium]